jgi:hypothetical protein
MLSRGNHTAIFIITMFMLLLLKDLLTKFLITCIIKDQRATWLCLIEGNLASLHDLVSFQIEHTKCSRIRSVTIENTIDRPSLKFILILALLQNKAFASKHTKVTHHGSAIVQHLMSHLLERSEKNPVRNTSAQNLLRVLCSSSIVWATSHKVLFFLCTTPFWGDIYGLENWHSRPKTCKMFRNESY